MQKKKNEWRNEHLDPPLSLTDIATLHYLFQVFFSFQDIKYHRNVLRISDITVHPGGSSQRKPRVFFSFWFLSCSSLTMSCCINHMQPQDHILVWQKHCLWNWLLPFNVGLLRLTHVNTYFSTYFTNSRQLFFSCRSPSNRCVWLCGPFSLSHSSLTLPLSFPQLTNSAIIKWD